MTTARPIAAACAISNPTCIVSRDVFPGMQREVQQVEAGVGDRVAEQRDVTEEDGRDRQPRDELRDQKRKGRVGGGPTILALVQAKRFDREEQQASRSRTPRPR